MIVNGQERLDGLAVSKWAVRFTGTHDLEIEDAERLALDKVVIFLCATRAGKFEVQVLDDGEVKRKNVATVSDFMVLQGEMRDRAISALANGSDHGLLTPPTYSGDENVADALAQIDELARKLMGDYDFMFDRSEGAVDMTLRILDDPRVKGVLAGTLGVVDLETGERVGHVLPLDPGEPATPTVVDELEELPEHELETDPGWTPADDSGWDPRDLPELAPKAEDAPESEADAPESEEPEPDPVVPPDSGGAPEAEEPAGPPRGQVVGHVNDRSSIRDVPARGGREGPGIAKFDPDSFDTAPEGPAPKGPERVGVGAHHRDPVLRRFMEEESPR